MTNAGRLHGGDAQPTESAESDWSDQIANAGDTPIGELVDGLHEVAALPIAYARLPRRAHTAYAEDFTCWGDIAGQTIESLLSRPKIGERAVQAMLAGGQRRRRRVSGRGSSRPPASWPTPTNYPAR